MKQRICWQVALSNFLDSPVEFEKPPVPHIRQKLSVPLSAVEVSENPTHYTHYPENPLQLKQLLLTVKGKRLGIVH